MERKELMKTAEEFAKIFWSIKNKIKIEDIMIFGSLAYGKSNPNDIDALLLHYNPIFDSFQNFADRKDISATKKLIILDELFKEQGGLTFLFRDTSVEELVLKNKFNLKYMNILFFKDEKYRKLWVEKNRKNIILQDPNKLKLRLPGEEFEHAIFRQGLLYNPKTQKYDIPATTKYSVPKEL